MPTCQITDVSQEDYDDAFADFKADVLSQGDLKDKNGLIIILAITDNQGPQGTTEDSKNMEKIFGSSTLKFAIWKIHYPDKYLKIAAVMKVAANYDYPESINKIFVYFTGHGGSTEKGRKYVIPHCKIPPKRRSYIEDDMIMFFEPSLGCKLGPKVSRVFLFDCCLSHDQTEDPEVPPKSVNVSSFRQPLVIAHSTSMGKKAGGKFDSGGAWTKQLCTNITNYPFLPFSYLLDMTWDSMVVRNEKQEAQGPHYLYYMGPLFLKEEYRDVYYKVTSADAVKSSFLPSQGGVATSGGGKTSGSTPSSIGHTFRNPDDIMDCRPEQGDLEAAILDDLKDSEYHIWNERFGKRLKGPNNTRLGMCTQPAHLINMFYDKRSGGPYHITWGSVLNALESPSTLKTKDGKEIVTSLRQYLSRKEVYIKYKPN